MPVKPEFAAYEFTRYEVHKLVVTALLLGLGVGLTIGLIFGILLVA